MALYSSATVAPKCENQNQLQLFDSRKRKYREIELEVNQNRFHCAALGENLLNYSADLREAFEKTAWEWDVLAYNRRLTAIPRAIEPPPPTPPLEQCDLATLSPHLHQPVECTACTDECHPSEVVIASCGHVYCDECLTDLFQTSMTDETLYPPRCCKLAIPLIAAREVLPRAFVFEFSDKVEELDTKDKTYCYRPECAVFIRPYVINGSHAKCQRCGEATCAECKGKWHAGECPRNDGVEALMAVAQANMWRQCPSCKRFVELGMGCFHITCRCKHEFCYICGETWRSCDCRKWDRERLYERARQLAPNFMPAEKLQQPQLADVLKNRQQVREEERARTQALERAVQHIRNNHDCGHPAFQKYKVNGQIHTCEICGRTFPTWINQCQQCFMLMCLACKYHRL